MVSLRGSQPKEESGLPEIPNWWMGSRPEYFAFWALLKLGYKNRFTYQSSKMGGRLSKGGAVLDFFIPELSLAINIQSVYFHYASTRDRVAGELQRAQLESMGIRVIFIDEQDILRDPIYYVSEALAGREHARIGK